MQARSVTNIVPKHHERPQEQTTFYPKNTTGSARTWHRQHKSRKNFARTTTIYARSSLHVLTSHGHQGRLVIIIYIHIHIRMCRCGIIIVTSISNNAWLDSLQFNNHHQSLSIIINHYQSLSITINHYHQLIKHQQHMIINQTIPITINIIKHINTTIIIFRSHFGSNFVRCAQGAQLGKRYHVTYAMMIMDGSWLGRHRSGRSGPRTGGRRTRIGSSCRISSSYRSWRFRSKAATVQVGNIRPCTTQPKPRGGRVGGRTHARYIGTSKARQRKDLLSLGS